MQIKRYFQNVARKALGFNPVYGAGLQMMFGNQFSWMSGNKISGYDNKIVYSGLNLLVKKLTEPNILVSKIKNEKELKKFYKSSIPNEKRALAKSQSMTELDSHPLIDLLEKPNSYQTRIELMNQFWFNYQYGDGYIIALNNDSDVGAESRSFKPKELHAINKNRVTPQRLNDRFNSIASYRIMLFNGESIVLYPNQVFHMKKWNPDNDLEGYNFINPAGKTISKNEANQVAQGMAFVNGGRGTLFSSDIGKEGEEKMTAPQMAELKKTMEKDYQGAVNNRKMNFTNGFVNVQNYGDTLAEMQLIEAEKADWKDIYTILGIPIVLGPISEASTESNVAAGYKALVTNSIVPDLRKFDLKFKYFLQPWFGVDIIACHDLTEFSELAPDLKLLKEVYGDAYYLTPNEKRTLFNFDTDDKTEGMDGYFMPSGLMPMSQLFELPEDPNIEGKQYDYR